MIKKILSVIKSAYFLIGVSFLVWMLFLDSNDLISRFKISAKVRALEDAKVYYQKKIEEVKKDQQELMTNKALLEKFAREKYMMKKESEDVYIIQGAE